MKKIFLMLAVLCLALGSFFGCDDDSLSDFEGLVFESKEYTYDGEVKSLAVENLPEGASVTYENNDKTEAGVYEVKATVTKEGFKTAVLNATLTIKEKPLSPADEYFKDVVFEDVAFTYDGTEKKVEATNLPENTTVTYENNQKTDAGIYEVKAKLVSGEFEKTLTAVLTINKAEAKITSNNVQTYTYDGTEKKVIASLNHDEAQLSISANSFINAGEYEINLSAPETKNYLAAEKTVKLVINKAKPKIITENVFNFVYDGTVKEVDVTTDVNTENLVIDSEGEVDAGTYVIKVEVLESENYAYVWRYVTMVIDKAETIIEAEELQSAVYTKEEQYATYRLNHSEGAATVQGATEIGDHEILISAPETKNYKAAEMTVTLRILPNMDFVSFEDKTVTYNGKEQSITVDGLQEGMSVIYENNTFRDVDSNLAKATVTVDLTKESREFEAVLTIEKAQMSITAEDKTMIVGRALPEFTVKTKGMFSTDKLRDMGEAVYECLSDGSETGNFAIKVSGFASDNYDIEFIDGTLSVVELETDLVVGGLQLDANGNTIYDGQKINWLGVNYFSMVSACYDGSVISENRVKSVMNSLETLQEYNVKAIRFNVGFFYADNWRNQYFTDPEGYFDLLERLFDKAAECNIGLVPSFFWTMYLLDYYGEHYVPAFENAATNNSQTITFMMDYTTMLVERFASHPAILMWEFGNEYNLQMDLPNWQDLNPGKDASLDKPTIAIHTQVIERWADTIRAADPYGRLIASGDAEYRKSNYNQYINNSWQEDSYDEHMEALKLYHPGNVDSISIHVYGQDYLYSRDNPGAVDGLLGTNNWEARLSLLVEMAAKLKKSCYVGEAGFSYTNYNNVTEEMLYTHYEAIIQAVKKTQLPLILFWNYDPETLRLGGDDLRDRGSGVEYSWNTGWEKGRIILGLIKENSI